MEQTRERNASDRSGDSEEDTGLDTDRDDDRDRSCRGQGRNWIADESASLYILEMAKGIGIVLLVGLVLVAISGVWPPVVAVPSTSMTPNLNVDDAVYVMEEHRLASEYAHADTGVVTYRRGSETGYTKFGRPGDVIVFRAEGIAGDIQVIHRAMFYVTDGENWYAEGRQVNPTAVGSASNCRELQNCPAPHAGFITKGDNAARYDQVNGVSPPVPPAEVVGTAEFSIPGIGRVRTRGIPSDS